MIELTEKDNGMLIHTSVGEIFCIRLKENPTTGYLWIRDKVNDKYIECINDEYEGGIGWDDEGKCGTPGVNY